MDIAEEFSRNTGRTSSDTETSEPLLMSSEWMCSAGDFHVKTSATPANAQESTESVPGCGLSTSDSFAWYDPATSSWRTWQLCLDGDYQQFSETWPRSGLVVSGIVFRPVQWEPRTGETECGS